MPFHLTLQEKVTDNTWRAIGTFSNSRGDNGKADVLLRETNEGLLLIVDDQIGESRVAGKKVTDYHNAQPVPADLEAGNTVTFNNFWYSLTK
ncbi:hypothetical protein [Xanthocytophaga agilis]|uniref:Uncharacterized protein n=1 Tax=Xanthocytophaga agilis TaxID=3048010 RepID=A0AAE3R343_9BACT|nr:hypothetical protein [Xanthocytophaga agilis]MDJ1500469.1 hypothetical protein [Xanthocytophaga agilis]